MTPFDTHSFCRKWIRDVFELKGEKVVWSRHGGKSSGTSDNNAIRAAAAMNDQEIAVCVFTANDTDVGIVRIEHKVARLRVAP